MSFTESELLAIRTIMSHAKKFSLRIQFPRYQRLPATLDCEPIEWLSGLYAFATSYLSSTRLDEISLDFKDPVDPRGTFVPTLCHFDSLPIQATNLRIISLSNTEVTWTVRSSLVLSSKNSLSSPRLHLLGLLSGRWVEVLALLRGARKDG
ncbi:hypothetical protein BCR34DRAFT_577699 [Clohesyomyces aquaticus]|uniref:Uncharacterized protein n=1 Tax=Clohesyomyces aquaticus TaxID=1231657 RepID=A0A1Y1YJV8_9PLEO|nr:hypothetical protein BCR34DRAFT_577699 [Clohesyomyces aquaticus]